MSIKEKIKIGKKILRYDLLQSKNRDLLKQNKKYSGKILSLNNEINKLKTTIIMMQNDKEDNKV